MADREDEKADRFGSEVSGGYAVSFSTGRTGAMSGGLKFGMLLTRSGFSLLFVDLRKWKITVENNS